MINIFPIIFNSAKQTRDFILVKDVIEADILAAEENAIGIYNIVVGEIININKLSTTITRLFNKRMMTIYQNARSGDINNDWADISKARGIGFHLKYSLEDGLRKP